MGPGLQSLDGRGLLARRRRLLIYRINPQEQEKERFKELHSPSVPAPHVLSCFAYMCPHVMFVPMGSGASRAVPRYHNLKPSGTQEEELKRELLHN